MFTILISIFASICFFLCSIFKIPETSKECSTVALGDPKFKKLIYVLIVGLRFDAYVPVEKEGLYFNNFSFMRDPEKLKTTFLSISGIPTATTCRVIGMMTGAPSNQIEEIFTFFMSNVSTESLLDKFTDREMMFYGDEVWPSSFKSLKNRAITISGFPKMGIDEDEIDLIQKIKKDKKSEIKFIHILSLDALGHKCGNNNDPRMKEAFLRADQLLIDLYDSIDDETLLVVTSDHGVTDDGAHGGNSKLELAATCGFYSRKVPLLIENEKSVYNLNFMKNFFDFSEVNTKADFIAPVTPYRIIHQDDILPTVSYLMGVSTPMNTYGNLIPYIVNDESAQIILANQKKQLTKKKIAGSDPVPLNYNLTREIYSESECRRPKYAIASLFFGIYSFGRIAWRSTGISCSYKEIAAYLVSAIFVSHSYNAFASEDLIWLLTFLITNFSFANLIFAIFFIKTPGRVFFEKDRIKTGLKQFDDTLEPIALLLMFVALKIFKFNKNRIVLNFNILKNIRNILPQLAFIIYNHFLIATFEEKITFGILYPSLDSLLTIHFKPILAINFIFFIKNLDINRNQATKNIILALIPFLFNFEKVNQSIDYKVFNAYSNDFGSLSNLTGVLSFTLISRIYFHRMFEQNHLGILLNLFSLFLCFACSWAIHGSLVFQYFFVGRLLFTTLFFVMDLVIECALYVIRSRNTQKLNKL